jgi:hypothetical protein
MRGQEKVRGNARRGFAEKPSERAALPAESSQEGSAGPKGPREGVVPKLSSPGLLGNHPSRDLA